MFGRFIRKRSVRIAAALLTAWKPVELFLGWLGLVDTVRAAMAPDYWLTRVLFWPSLGIVVSVTGVVLLILIERRLRLDRSQEKYSATADVPILRIQFEHAPPYEELQTGVGPDPRVTWTQKVRRIRVVNTDEKRSIDAISVRLERTDPSFPTFHSMPLHLMHDNPEHESQFKREFSLGPLQISSSMSCVGTHSIPIR